MFLRTISVRNGVVQPNEEVTVNSENICQIYVRMHPDSNRMLPSPIVYNGVTYYLIITNTSWVGPSNLYISDADYRKLMSL